MEKPDRDDPESVKFIPMKITNYPLRENVVGQAGKFIDDFNIAMDGEMIYKTMGVDSDKSFLITGAPGNGKTMCIEALVNETNVEAFEDMTNGVPIKDLTPNLFGFKYDIGKYGTCYINEGSKIIQGFFDQCFRVASAYKTLVIFDEAENLFGNRAMNTGHKEDNKVLDTIMKNLQRLHDTDNMYCVMMSNFPEAFDEASIRAGRVDKRYEFTNPNLSEREFAYKHAINQINKNADYSVIRGYNTRTLANKSNGFSYADVVESVSSAVKLRAKQITENRKNKIITAGYINQKRLEESINQHKENFVTKKGKRIGFL